MRKQRRAPKTSVLIACEGTVTEYTYFERLKEEIEEQGTWAITVYPDRDAPADQNPKTSALQLVKLAKERSADYDEVWVVFDKDGYALHAEAFELALSDRLGKRLHIAFSSIAFEQWVLAHFEREAHAYLKSECRQGKQQLSCGTMQHADDCGGAKCVCGRLRTQGYLPDYGKSADYDLYPKIRARLPQALENAAWLRSLHRDNSIPRYELNPHTDVDELVKKLLNIEEQILWAGLGQWMRLDHVACNLQVVDRQYRMTVQNIGPVSMVMNQLQFSSIDRLGARSRISVPNALLEPQGEFQFDLEIPENPAEMVVVELKAGAYTVLFQHAQF
jgi:RloB-like protein